MGKTILLVDDNVDTREMLHMYLTSNGYSVVMASTGGEGLYLAGSERPDLILTDIGLGDIDGTELIKSVKQNPELEGVPVVALTALADLRAEDIKDAGADRLIGKPMDPAQLLSVIKDLLGEREE